MRTHTLFVPVNQFLTTNHRVHWGVRARVTAQIRHDAAWVARAARVPTVTGPVRIVAYVHRGHAGRGRWDPSNWALTLKPAIDGLVDAGVLRDDDHTRLTAVEYRAGDPRPGNPGITLTIEPDREDNPS